MTDTASSASLDAVAHTLQQAWRGGPAADDVALAAALKTPADAYAVQDRLLAGLDGPGAGTPRWWKSGGPSRDAALTHAPLPAGGVRPSGSDTAGLHLRSHLIEAEVAFRLARDVTAADAAALRDGDNSALVDAVAVSIELVDSRWRNARQAPALLKLADMQSHGALVLGEFVPVPTVDWSAQVCEVRIGTGAPQSFRGTHSLGHPLWLLPTWLRHATARCGTIAAGTVVTTGTWCGLLPAQAGDRVEVTFPGIGAARVQL
jgi:2-keto-4-pentenoate hydratase